MDVFQQRPLASPDRKFDRVERNHSRSSELSQTPAETSSKRRKLDDKVLCLCLPVHLSVCLPAFLAVCVFLSLLLLLELSWTSSGTCAAGASCLDTKHQDVNCRQHQFLSLTCHSNIICVVMLLLLKMTMTMTVIVMMMMMMIRDVKALQ